ncbi:MAG: T9SS type A sorting domain-containing protein [Bacteroidota bacterium]
MQHFHPSNSSLTQRSLVKKWGKLHARLERKLQNKTFYQLSTRKQRQLVDRLSKCYAQLVKVGISLKYTAVAGSMALALLMGSKSHAQTFVEQTGANNPLNAVDLRAAGLASFVDIDGDGDLDMFAEVYDTITFINSVAYFQNTGSRTSPVFIEQTGANNPLNGISSDYLLLHEFVDIDGDGDLDVFLNGIDGTTYGFILQYYQNTGSATSPTFTKQPGTNNPLEGLKNANYFKQAFVDLDGDGDLDALFGDAEVTTNDGIVDYYENTGTSNSPAFTRRTGMGSPFDGITTSEYGPFMAPIDLDMDGDTDFFFTFYDNASNSVAMEYYLNTGSTMNPSFAKQASTTNPFNSLNVGEVPVPFFADIDGDGDMDAFFSQYDGTFKYFRNEGGSMGIFDAQGNETNDRLGDLYPNPSQDGLVNLNYTATELGQIEVSVFDRAGKMLDTHIRQVLVGKNQLSFDFTSLSTGLYLIRFEEDGKAAFRKLVIE